MVVIVPYAACFAKMTTALPKRIIKETERLQNEPVPGISAQPHDDNARYFDVMVEGPGGSCYEGLRAIFDSGDD